MARSARPAISVLLVCALAFAMAPIVLASAGPIEPLATDLPGEPLLSGQTVEDTIGPAGTDRRVYSVDLAPGELVRLTLDADIAVADLELRLYDPATTDLAELTRRIAVSDTPISYPAVIEYLVPPDGGGTYYVAVTVFQPPVQAVYFTLACDIETPQVHRLAGLDRYATSIAISRSSFATSTAAVLATGANYPDALAASALAGALDAPLLLVRDSVFTDSFQEMVFELERVGATDLFVVGGSAVISDAVVTYLRVDRGFDVVRLWGDDRYETAGAVAERVTDLVVGGGGTVESVFLVRGDDFADALAAGPYAFSQHMPVLLTPRTWLHPVAAGYIETYDVLDVTVVGGDAAVASGVQTTVSKLNAGHTGVARVSGASRYETAANLAHHAVEVRAWASWEYVGVATGLGFPDALSGAAATGRRGGVLLLTRPAAFESAPKARMDASIAEVSTALLYGGPVVLSDGLAAEIGAMFP